MLPQGKPQKQGVWGRREVHGRGTGRAWPHPEGSAGGCWGVRRACKAPFRFPLHTQATRLLADLPRERQEP